MEFLNIAHFCEGSSFIQVEVYWLFKDSFWLHHQRLVTPYIYWRWRQHNALESQYISTRSVVSILTMVTDFANREYHVSRWQNFDIIFIY